MARRFLKGEHPIPVQIIATDVEGDTPTFTIQHLSEEDEDYSNDFQGVVEEEDSSSQQSSQNIEQVTYVTSIKGSDQHHIQQQLQQSTSPSFSQASNSSNDLQEFSMQQSSSSSSRSNKTKAFYCPNCGNCYGAAGSLKLHIRACLRQKETEEKALEARKCNICGKIYNSISYLKEHILRHTGKAPRKCPKCYRKFVDYDKLEAHIKSHDNEVLVNDEGNEEKKIIKEYNCSFCQKKFQVVFDSRYTKRRYACDECRDKFTNEENLKLHKESLEEKKDFHCDRCGRRFVFEGFLQRHAPNCDGTIKRKRDRVF